MVAQQHLIIFIFHVLHIILCTSVCRYDEPYILWNNTNFPIESGYYVRSHLDIRDCGLPTPTFNGTWVYILNKPPNPILYLSHYHAGVANYLMISTGACEPFTKRFGTTFLNGTNCDWTLIDDKNTATPIPWRFENDTILPGQTILCDRNSFCDSPNPTLSPTKSPVPTTAQPSADPTTPYPTGSPSASTDAPSKTPTKSPTVKPSNLPTVLKPLYDQPPCVAMTVTNLHIAFPKQAEYKEKFNQKLNVAYNQRRVWSNGGGKLEIFYTNRYEPGRWVISNGTYHLINDFDMLVNGGINQSFPGDDTGHGLYDHFPNDNPIGKPNATFTLRFECQNSSIYGTRYPSGPPSPAPSIAPTIAPSVAPSLAPTYAPISLCNRITFIVSKYVDTNTSNNACNGVYDKMELGSNMFFSKFGQHNNHSYWRQQLPPPKDWALYYSMILESWVVNFLFPGNQRDLQGLVHKTEQGLETPPQGDSTWYYVQDSDIFTPACSMWVNIFCENVIVPTSAWHRNTPAPTPSPSSAPSMAPVTPPTLAPTTPPSNSPSYSPTVAPTGSPTLLCGGLTVGIDSNKYENKYDIFRGDYRRQDENDLIANHFWWQHLEVHNTRIFYSDVTFHNTWVVQSKEASSYWLLPEYNHNLYYLQPPLSTNWEYYSGKSIFALDTAIISFNCTKPLLTTTDPTLSPSIAPTTPPSVAPSIAPSFSPSHTPSIAPSLTPTNHPTTPAPTNTPSIAPSIAPTTAPTRETCDYLQVKSEDDLFSFIDGLYDIIPNHRNGFPAWIFTNNYGQTYIIEKKSTGNYWIINKINVTINGTIPSVTDNSLTSDDFVTQENSYNWRPPIFGWWASWRTQPKPTHAPTIPPSNAPSHMTHSPTITPSNAPTSLPTTDPTIEPTTDPSNSPTIEPTNEPTAEPTQDTNIPTSQPTLEPTVQPTSGPTNEPTLEPTDSPINRRRRDLLQVQPPPPQGTEVINIGNPQFQVLMDCVNTDSPTYAPTTSEPTRAPTSKCVALRINSVIISEEFFWIGEYVRMDYLINNKPWFIATHGNSSLEFIDNQWTIMRRDRDAGNDEDAILIYRNETYPNPLTWLLQSQYNKLWYNILYKTEIMIDIICMGSIPPTPSPSFSPTIAPTIESVPIWINCKNNWFTFVTFEQFNEINNKTYSIYWDIPQAVGQETGHVEVDIIEEETSKELFLNESSGRGEIMIQGEVNFFEYFGMYSILYRAYNIYNENDTNGILTNDCKINLYVIGHTLFDTSEYCFNEKFTIDIVFNETFYEINNYYQSSEEYEYDTMINIIGLATNMELRDLNENCYVYGKQLINITQMVTVEADSSTYLGIEANAFVWDLLIILVLLCLFGLCCWRLYFCHRKYKENKYENDNQSQALLHNNNNSNDDDLVIEDINPTNTTGNGSGSGSGSGSGGQALLSSAKRQHQPGSLSDDDEQQEELGGRATNDQAIDALIGDAFDDDGFVTRGGDGGNGEGGGAVEMQPIQQTDSLDQGGDLPIEDNEQQSEPQLPQQPLIPPPVPPQPQQQQEEEEEEEEEEEDSEFDNDSEFEFRV